MLIPSLPSGRPVIMGCWRGGWEKLGGNLYSSKFNIHQKNVLKFRELGKHCGNHREHALTL